MCLTTQRSSQVIGKSPDVGATATNNSKLDFWIRSRSEVFDLDSVNRDWSWRALNLNTLAGQRMESFAVDLDRPMQVVPSSEFPEKLPFYERWEP